jgi:hypothetical protein
LTLISFPGPQAQLLLRPRRCSTDTPLSRARSAAGLLVTIFVAEGIKAPRTTVMAMLAVERPTSPERQEGDVRYRWDGELDWKGAKGRDVTRQIIEELLAEKGRSGRRPRPVSAFS